MVAGNIKRELYVGMEAEECRNQTPGMEGGGQAGNGGSQYQEAEIG